MIANTKANAKQEMGEADLTEKLARKNPTVKEPTKMLMIPQ